MGGYSSGQSGWGRRKVDDTLAIDIRALRKSGDLEKPGTFTTVGLYAGAGNLLASCVIEIQRDSIVVAWPMWDRNKGRIKEWRPKVRQVAIERTACNFGGLRRWFICRRCGRQVVSVYIAGDELGCRHCHDLRYSSQSETAADRARGRERKIRRRLGMGPSLVEPIETKPKFMRWATFFRLRSQAYSYQAAGMADMQRFVEKYRRRG